MLVATATVLAALVSLGTIFLGVRAFRVPQAAVGFGIPETPVEDPSFHAWLGVKAVRDIACGLFILILLVGATQQLTGWFMLIAAGIPVGDAVIVHRSRGPKSASYGIHGVTAAVMLAISLLLIAA
ncbi:MAG TPA: DUF4267 domain-containing protein [Actinomycetales bacterium]|nr:DUF4267 domain-containing protein [Actinomycetales bacterium]